jgi:mannuronan 5-epimerase
MRLLTACVLACLFVSGPVVAKPDGGLLDEIRSAVAAHAEPEALLTLAKRLAPAAPRTAVPPAVASDGTSKLEVRAGEIQAALTQLSILSGGNGHLSLQLAQASVTDVIYLVSGTATLADLGDLIQHRETGWYLSRPLVIWPGASLVLQPGDVLELDTASGAFVLSFGSIILTGATLRGDGGENPVVPMFRPFLLVTGQGTFRADESTFANLGFDGPVAFRGVTVLTGGLMKPADPPVVTGSRFDRVFSLSFEGADGMVVADSRFGGAGAAAISIRDGNGVTLVGNRIIDTAEGAGIRLSGRLQDIALVGNLVADGERNGVQIDGTTKGLVLRGNAVTGNAQSGVSIRNATCAAVQGNIIAGNGTTGLRLSRSGAVRVADNAILNNNGSGFELSAQGALAPVLLSDNLVADNREGLRAAGLGEVRLAGNDLDDQLPRQFAGDFAPWLGQYLTADAALVIPAAAGAQAVPASSCQKE